MTVAPPLLVKEFLFKVCTHGGLLLIVKLQKSCGHQNRFWRGKSFEKPRLVAASVEEEGFPAAASRYIILLEEFRRQAKMVLCALIFIGAFAAFAVLEVYLFNRFCSGYVIKSHPEEDGLYAWEKRSQFSRTRWQNSPCVLHDIIMTDSERELLLIWDSLLHEFVWIIHNNLNKLTTVNDNWNI